MFSCHVIVTQAGCKYAALPAKSGSGVVAKEDAAAALKDALAAAGLTEEEAKQEQQQQQERDLQQYAKLGQHSRMRQGFFGFLNKYSGSNGGAAAAGGSSSNPAGVSIAAIPAAADDASAGPAAGGAAGGDPLAITHKAEFNVTSGGKLVGKVVLGLFGNTAPKAVQNVSGKWWCRGHR